MAAQSLDLAGRSAIVTGAAAGIGKAIAHKLHENGARVLAADVNRDALGALSARSDGSGDSFQTCLCDVSSVADLSAMVDTCVKHFGGVDILVNNAGVLQSTAIEEITEAEWDRVMAINLKSMFFAAQKALPYMKAQRWGRIINMSSLAGRMGGYANGLAYSASKAGIIGLSQGMARRVAPHNITVNAIAPGPTETDLIRQFSAEQKEQLRAMIPLGRLGAVEDIAQLVLFLSSDMAGFLTGTVIDINGGMHMG